MGGRPGEVQALLLFEHGLREVEQVLALVVMIERDLEGVPSVHSPSIPSGSSSAEALLSAPAVRRHSVRHPGPDVTVYSGPAGLLVMRLTCRNYSSGRGWRLGAAESNGPVLRYWRLLEGL